MHGKGRTICTALAVTLGLLSLAVPDRTPRKKLIEWAGTNPTRPFYARTSARWRRHHSTAASLACATVPAARGLLHVGVLGTAPLRAGRRRRRFRGPARHPAAALPRDLPARERHAGNPRLVRRFLAGSRQRAPCGSACPRRSRARASPRRRAVQRFRLRVSAPEARVHPFWDEYASCVRARGARS